MFGTLRIVALFLLASGAAIAAIPVEVDYMPMFTEQMVQEAVTGANLRQWQVHTHKVGPKFVELRTTFATHMRTEAGKKGIELPPVDQLPHPQLHRMIFNLFAKKAGFLRKPAEQVAFLARVYLDLDVIRWGKLGEADLSVDVLKTPVPKFPLKINCNGFIKFCCYMAGLPRVAEEFYSLADRNRMPKGELIMETARVLDDDLARGGWSGWYYAARDAASGWPAEPAKVDIEPGDLVSLYTQHTTPNPDGSRYVNQFSWNHVEVVVRGCLASGPPSKLEFVLSIGNSTHPLSGSKAHFSYLWGKLSGAGRYLDKLAPEGIDGKIIGHRQAIFKPRDRFADGKAKNPDKFVLP
jgi:hypothetical protein